MPNDIRTSHRALLNDLRKSLHASERDVQQSYILLAWDGVRDFLEQCVPAIDKYISVSGDIGDEFVNFVEWSNYKNHSLDWRMALIAYKYLHEKRRLRDRLLCQECMLTTASQWCFLDKSRMKSCIIQSRDYGNLIVLGEKSTNASVDRGLYLIDEYKAYNSEKLFTLKFFVEFSGELGHADAEAGV